MPPLRLLIVSENISMQMGGEGAIPFFYAKQLMKRGVVVWLACHERVEAELRASFPELGDRIRFARDTRMQMAMFRYGKVLPYRIRDTFIGQAVHFSTQRQIQAIARELAQAGQIDAVLEPTPITPKGLSFMYDLGVPVIMGPLCGGMNFPPAFVDLDSRTTRISMAVGRRLAHVANRVVPGKIKADVLLMANSASIEALPAGYRGRVIRMFDSAVDLDVWKPAEVSEEREDGTVHFAFSGRFVDWKGIQYLVPAFAKAVAEEPRCRLHLIGGGELEAEVKAEVERRNLRDSVYLHGWLGRPEAAKIVREADVFVMPSLRECGGSAMLEAMAVGKPVVATKWGGPADYVNDTCGRLVDPVSKQGFVDGLGDAMVRLARSPELRRSLGEGAKLRVLQDGLNWNAKVDQLLSILTETVSHAAHAG